MGGRDHSVTCPRCDVDRGGFDDLKCRCDRIEEAARAFLPDTDIPDAPMATKMGWLEDQAMKLTLGHYIRLREALE